MRIDAKYRVTTPLFCAGADRNHPEVRLSSFKGALRFWWRAMAWSRCGGKLDDIQRQENDLFGSAGGGQSKVPMRLTVTADLPKISSGKVLCIPSTNRTVGAGVRYLGYGVMEAFPSSRKNKKAGQLTRSCLKAPFEFTVGIRSRDLTEIQQMSLDGALIALGTIGGIGAKSRKGYGSLVLRSLAVNGKEKWTPPQDLEELKKKITDLLGKRVDHGLPEFTAVSERSRHVLLRCDRHEPLELLDLIGRELVRYRSWGRNRKILGNEISSEQRFKDDHDLMKGILKGHFGHPRRIAFGLPHNYGNNRHQQVGPAEDKIDRRASPLFIHIHECGSSPVAVVSFLPARFLPEGRSDISVGRRKVRQKPEDELYRPIHEFLDRLLTPGERKEQFKGVSEIPS